MGKSCSNTIWIQLERNFLLEIIRTRIKTMELEKNQQNYLIGNTYFKSQFAGWTFCIRNAFEWIKVDLFKQCRLANTSNLTIFRINYSMFIIQLTIYCTNTNYDHDEWINTERLHDDTSSTAAAIRMKRLSLWDENEDYRREFEANSSYRTCYFY